jgi:dTDP-4-dehydrorhamnose reductase
MLKYPQDQELRVVDDQYSSPTYAPHLALAIEKLLSGHDFGTYHLVNAGVASRYTQLTHFFDKMGITRVVTPVKMHNFLQPARRPRYTVLTSAKLKDITLPPWQDGIAAAAEDLKKK